MSKIIIRPQRVSDARAMFEILVNKNFRFFDAGVRKLEDEVKFLKRNARKRRDSFEYNFTILLDGKIVGGCGIKINQHRPYIGEIGYFVDEREWGKGIATRAVKLLEGFGFKKLKLQRIEILIHPQNTASVKVAIKSGYQKEGRMKKAGRLGNNPSKVHDFFLYAKAK